MSRAALSVIIFVIVGLALPAGTIVINLFCGRGSRRTSRKKAYLTKADRSLSEALGPWASVIINTRFYFCFLT